MDRNNESWVVHLFKRTFFVGGGGHFQKNSQNFIPIKLGVQTLSDIILVFIFDYLAIKFHFV